LSPNGIVSFELARTPERVSAIMAGWTPLAKLYAALGLGLDYLFMPSYALTIALGVLLALKRHGGWFASLGIWVGWGSLAAALFDAFENIALWETLAHGVNLTWPQVAFWCASFKFGLILIGMDSLYWVRSYQSPCRMRNKKIPAQNERGFLSGEF